MSYHKRPRAYEELRAISERIQTYQSILSLLHWDQETYMPSGGITARGAQISLLSGLIHQEKTSRTFKKWLEKLVSLSTTKIKAKNLCRGDKINVREWCHDFLRQDKLPNAFVKEFAQVTAESTQVWSIAKKQNNFKLFAPFLGKIVALSRQKAEYFGFSDHPYDALLSYYEPCITMKKMGTIFDSLKGELQTLLKKIKASSPPQNSFLHRKVPEDKQNHLAHKLLSYLPMEAGYSRLDLSSHPFSTAMHPHDSRITTRIAPKDFLSNLFSVLHEAGHSMYEMGLPTEWWGTPLAESISLSIHESQSRWWETRIGRSFGFWKFFYPKLQKELPSLFKGVSLKKFYRATHRVKPTFIRVEADEVTYNLHVLIRFELEKELIGGKLAVHDLPEAWNAKMKEVLGIVPPTDREGCLQDIHWSLGDFGYFPTYTLGNLFAAQFFAKFMKDHPDWEERVAKGEFDFVRLWLRTKIHRVGRTYNADELIKKVTGKPLSETFFCTYLKKKYGEIYSL